MAVQLHASDTGSELSAVRSGWPVLVSQRRQAGALLPWCLVTPVSVPALAASGFLLRATDLRLESDLLRIRAYLTVLQLFHLVLLRLASSAAAATLTRLSPHLLS